MVAEWGLGRGESAVIALAMELGATAILDDRSARRCATALRLPVIGTFGVIVRAKQHGVIATAQPVIRSVVDAGLYYDDEALRTLLSRIGASWP
jgi:predicted nucleic acid-binding protein